MTHSSCIVVEAPKTEPVSLALARKQCRFTADNEDELIELYIAAARETTQDYLRRSLIRQKRRLTLDAFPRGCINLPFGRALEVEAITYQAQPGEWTALDAQSWEADLDSDIPRIVPRSGLTWPSVAAGLARVRVDYFAGYGTAESAVPANIRAAMLLMIAESFENREDSITGTIAEIPASSRNLLRPYVIHGVL